MAMRVNSRPRHRTNDEYGLYQSTYNAVTPNRDGEYYEVLATYADSDGISRRERRAHFRKFPKWKPKEERGYHTKNWTNPHFTSCRLSEYVPCLVEGVKHVPLAEQMRNLITCLETPCSARGLYDKNGKPMEGFPLYWSYNTHSWRFRHGMRKILVAETGFSAATIWRILTGAVAWIYTFNRFPPNGCKPITQTWASGKWDVYCPRYETVWNGEKRRGRYIHKSNFIIQGFERSRLLNHESHPEQYAEGLGLSIEETKIWAGFKMRCWGDQEDPELTRLGVELYGNPLKFQWKVATDVWEQWYPQDGVSILTGYEFDTPHVTRFAEDIVSARQEDGAWRFTTDNWPATISQTATGILQQFAAEGNPQIDDLTRDELYLFGFNSRSSNGLRPVEAELTISIVNRLVSESKLRVVAELSDQSLTLIEQMRGKTAKVKGEEPKVEEKAPRFVTKIHNISKLAFDLLKQMADTDRKLKLSPEIEGELDLFEFESGGEFFKYSHHNAEVEDIWRLYDYVQLMVDVGKMEITEEPAVATKEMVLEFQPYVEGTPWPDTISRKAFEYLVWLDKNDKWGPTFRYDMVLVNELAKFNIDARDADCPDTRKIDIGFLQGLMTPNRKGRARLTMVD